MNEFTLRALIAAVIAIGLFVQSRKAEGQRRQRAFLLSALAFVVLAVGNGLAPLGVDTQIVWIITVVGMLLVLGSFVLLIQAQRTGEMNNQLDRMRDMMKVERERRDNVKNQD